MVLQERSRGSWSYKSVVVAPGYSDSIRRPPHRPCPPAGACCTLSNLERLFGVQLKEALPLILLFENLRARKLSFGTEAVLINQFSIAVNEAFTIAPKDTGILKDYQIPITR